MKLCIAFLGLASTLLADPACFTVASGEAQATFTDNSVKITNSDGTILDWPMFSIPKEHRFIFEQPNHCSTVCNRVVGLEKSLLEGTLLSNGKVILVNPNGIFFSKSAIVDTAGFIASTLQMEQEEGVLHFHTPKGGEIVNEGTILCGNGDLLLIAPQIENNGLCEAHRVEFVSTNEVWIHPIGKRHVFIKQGEKDLSESPYSSAIRHTGRIIASSILEENGRVFLVAEQGSAIVSGSIQAKGGIVHVLGDHVLLEETAFINASGMPGGEILIGGDLRGSNPEIQNAKQTIAKQGALVKANGKDTGNGGKIIYWSDAFTSVASHTDASAGFNGGNGGFIEISGKCLDFRGTVSTLAPNGKTGICLFDPLDLIISSSPTINVTAAPTFQPTSMMCVPTPISGSNLNIADLTAALSMSSVVIDTTTTVGMCLGTITFDGTAVISYTESNDLTINSAQDVIFETGSSITNMGTGNLTINAQREILINPGVTISFAGGDIEFSGGINSMGQFNAEDYHGITLSGNASPSLIETTGSGHILFTGVGGEGNMAASRGIFMEGSISASNMQITTVDGSITFIGSATNSTGFSDAILIQMAEVTTTNGLISMQGTTFASNGSGSQGIQLQDSTYVTATGAGSIELIGSAVGNIGLLIQQGSQVTTNTGSIFLQGTDPVAAAISLSGTPSTGLIESFGGGQISVIGNGVNSIALIMNNTTVTTSGRIFGSLVGSATLNGGSFIAPTGSAPVEWNVVGNLTLTSTPLLPGIAQIGSNQASSSAPIYINVSGNTTLTGTDGYNAIIGHGDPAMALSPLTGNIQVHAGGDIQLTGTGGFAQIGHVSSMGGGSTIGGNILVNANGNVTLTQSGDYARIGHGGANPAIFLPSTTQVFTGVSLISNAGQIVNQNGPLTLVVDNLYPAPFGFGSGSLYIGSGSLISSTGELRLYSVIQNQNTILAPINGVTFTPGPFNINTATEEWSIYYPDGSYGATPFKFYYKLPLIGFVIDKFYENIAANLTALNNLLPILRAERLPFQFPAYLAKACYLYVRPKDLQIDQTRKEALDCGPTLAPYGSFIFEDPVWWVDMSFISEEK